MKPDKNKDITEHIAEMLKGHSLPYEEGAWERFKDFESAKKRKLVLWPYFTGAAAALVLLVMSLFLIIGKDENNNQQIAKQEVVKDIIDTSNGDATNRNEPIDSEKVVSSPAPSSILIAGLNKRKSPVVSNVLSESNSLSVEQGDLSRTDILSTSIYNSDTSGYKDVQPNTSTQSIASNSKTPTPRDISTTQSYTSMEPLSRNDIDDSNTKKWDFSLELSPNIKDKDVNFGGGFAIAYNLNDKISIGSGVSYMHLDAQREPNGIDIPAEFSTLDGSKNKSLNNVSTSLVGLDIPINLKMNMGNSMYVNAGVSVFSVLNESRYNNFEERISVTALASPTFSSADDRKEKSGVEAQSLRSQEVNSSTPYEGKNFTGFFNFSVGYKLPFFPKMNLAIEPYFKIPIGSLSDQDMDLNNGGFKIKASF